MGLVFEDKLFDFVELMRFDASVFCESYRLEPIFALVSFEADMNVGRFIAFIRVEMKSIRTYSQDGWHGRFEDGWRRSSSHESHDVAFAEMA